MLTKDALWNDISNNIPTTVLNRRLKTGPVTIVTDIEKKAETRAQKRRQKENNRRNREPLEEPSVNGENTPSAADERRETEETTCSEPVDRWAERENEAIAPEPVPATQTSIAWIEKMECAKCDGFVSLGELQLDSNGDNVCLHCKNSSPRDTGSPQLTIKQESEGESDIGICTTQLASCTKGTLFPMVEKKQPRMISIDKSCESDLEVVGSRKRKRGGRVMRTNTSGPMTRSREVKLEANSDSE